jgi:NAD(P)-dependent dehydrogenase (short-subunit alcohol dehydrogenase family)
MLGQGGRAAIVNTASGAGLFGLPRMAPYCASKFGVVGLSEALDAELAPRGIRVSAICPGIIDAAITRTSILRGGMGEERDEIVSLYSRRGASPDDVAETVLAAVERPRPVRTVPVSHVAPIWLLKRLSPRLGGFAIRTAMRLRNRRP